MPRGPIISDEVKAAIVELALEEPRLPAHRIRSKLKARFNGRQPVPGVTSIQRLAKQARDKQGTFWEEEWSGWSFENPEFAALVPPQSSSALFDIASDLKVRQFPLTNRLAVWCVRLAGAIDNTPGWAIYSIAEAYSWTQQYREITGAEVSTKALDLFTGFCKFGGVTKWALWAYNTARASKLLEDDGKMAIFPDRQDPGKLSKVAVHLNTAVHGVSYIPFPGTQIETYELPLVLGSITGAALQLRSEEARAQDKKARTMATEAVYGMWLYEITLTDRFSQAWAQATVDIPWLKSIHNKLNDEITAQADRIEAFRFEEPGDIGQRYEYRIDGGATQFGFEDRMDVALRNGKELEAVTSQVPQESLDMVGIKIVDGRIAQEGKKS